jgi:uncharacterized membrane protein (UPF0127 family)
MPDNVKLLKEYIKSILKEDAVGFAHDLSRASKHFSGNKHWDRGKRIVEPGKMINLRINGAQLSAYVADNGLKRAKGLSGISGIEKIKNGYGMIFTWPVTDFRSFWMKGTHIPLDIAFMDSTGKILEIKELVPYSLNSVISTAPVMFALEVPRGWFSKNGVKVGTEVVGLDI